MARAIETIADPQVKLFYTLYLPQSNILRDFYQRLSEDQFDYRLIDVPERRADSPRESLAHLLEYRLIVFNGVKTGTLVFTGMGSERYQQMTKDQLLAAWEQIEQELFTYLTDEHFESEAKVSTPWGTAMTAIECLYLIRDHDILHIGWNLALMDLLSMERFPSLMQYWG
jgi:uncharacterized damage-inducible protein DinB